MGNPPEKPIPSLKADSTDLECQAVTNVIASLLTATKSHALYPDNHAMRNKAVSQFTEALQKALGDREFLRLNVNKESFFFEDKMVYETPPGPESLPFLFYRDGIQWLEFRRGIESSEVVDFLKILDRYRDIQEEGEGDLVTALWEADFPHLRHVAVDIYWDSEPVEELGALNAGHFEPDGSDQPEEEKDSIAIVPAEPANHRLWELNAEEISELRRMVEEEANRDPIEDVLDILLFVIEDQGEAGGLAQVLGFLKDEFQDALAQCEFVFLHKLLSAMLRTRQTYRTEKPWAVPLIDQFFKTISSAEVLGVLAGVLPSLDTRDSDSMKALGQFLLLFPSDAIIPLGSMLAQVDSPIIERQIMKTIQILAARDLDPLISLLNSPDEVLVQKLVHVLGHLKGERPMQILLKMFENQSSRVRKQALKALLSQNGEATEILFPLIEDSDDSIRWLMLKHLGKHRSLLAEKLLIDYLAKREFRVDGSEHILACYTALGKCGSSECVPFLRGVLFRKRWMPGGHKSLHRRGAAMALSMLKTEEAEIALHRAARSAFPSVRHAYRMIKEL